MIGRIVTVGVMLMVLAFNSTPASADGPAAQPAPSPLTAEEQLRAADKGAVAQKYLAHKRAGGSVADFSAELAALQSRLGGDPMAQRSGGQPSQVLTGEQGNIYPTWNLQEQGWWCGPANAWIAVQYHYDGLNSYYDEELIQTSLANSNWLQTTYPGGTGFGSNWPETLNGWRTNNPNGWWIRTVSPSAESLAGAVVIDVDSFHVSVIDVQMNATRGYLAGYTAGEGDQFGNIWHYVSATGYSDYGNVVGYLDTSSLGSPGYNVNYATVFATMTSGGYGLIW